MNISSLILTCAPLINPYTMDALIHTESGYNANAIAVVSAGIKISNPIVKKQALVAIKKLNNANYSIGLAQINSSNFKKYNVTAEQLLDPCTNLKISQKILIECYSRSPNMKISEALSCYYSGNFKYGFRDEEQFNNTSYITRIINNVSKENDEYDKLKNNNYTVGHIKKELKFIENRSLVINYDNSKNNIKSFFYLPIQTENIEQNKKGVENNELGLSILDDNNVYVFK